MTGLRLRHLAFTGSPRVPVARLDFADGLNIVYGASNTGKSFVVKSLDFMLGGAQPLPGIEQRSPYSGAWLGLALGGGRTVTLFRSTSGGESRLYDGLVVGDVEDVPYSVLGAQHDRKRADSVSRFLLDAMGLDGKVAVRNAQGEKDSVTIRTLVPFMLVGEEIIISERSPARASGQHVRQTFEANVLKLLLTGNDDAAVVTALTPEARKTAHAAKLEMLDELIDQARDEFDGSVPNRADLDGQSGRLDLTLSGLKDDLAGKQDEIDAWVRERRELADSVAGMSVRLAEVELMSDRYARLAQVYSSDIDRLLAIEESGFALLALAGRDCAVCGAPPEAQRATHGLEEVEGMQGAATAEIRKIESERADLRRVEASLAAEAVALRARCTETDEAIADIEARLAAARPREATLREGYEGMAAARDAVNRKLVDLDRLDRLVARRTSLETDQPTGTRVPPVSVGLDGSTSFRFAKTMREVLAEWGFPNAGEVQFDTTKQDFLVAGKDRAANGKGVRALLHAAFKLAVMLFCHRNGLPHPGVLVLDTPLLTYREPLDKKHGDLAPDEMAIRQTGLAERFYAHLASLGEVGQFIVLENSDPPAATIERAAVTVFTGDESQGRRGFF